MTVVDGNARAGALAEHLGADTTSALLRCAGCGDDDVLARTRVHVTAMGAVARCHGCDTVLVTVVDTPVGRWVGLPGVRVHGTIDA